MTHWSSRYIGIPYCAHVACDRLRCPGMDCAELAAHVAREVFAVQVMLPTERSRSLGERSRTIASLAADYAAPVADPADGDVVLMRKGRALGAESDPARTLWHVGIYCALDTRPWVLHNTSTSGASTLVPVSRLSELGLWVEGYYRWV